MCVCVTVCIHVLHLYRKNRRLYSHLTFLFRLFSLCHLASGRGLMTICHVPCDSSEVEQNIPALYLLHLVDRALKPNHPQVITKRVNRFCGFIRLFCVLLFVSTSAVSTSPPACLHVQVFTPGPLCSAAENRSTSPQCYQSLSASIFCSFREDEFISSFFQSLSFHLNLPKKKQYTKNPHENKDTSRPFFQGDRFGWTLDEHLITVAVRQFELRVKTLED